MSNVFWSQFTRDLEARSHGLPDFQTRSNEDLRSMPRHSPAMRGMSERQFSSSSCSRLQTSARLLRNHLRQLGQAQLEAALHSHRSCHNLFPPRSLLNSSSCAMPPLPAPAKTFSYKPDRSTASSFCKLRQSRHGSEAPAESVLVLEHWTRHDPDDVPTFR